MEENLEKIKTFVQIFQNLPKIARPEAIKQLVGILDSDEMDMMIEIIDTKIDDTTKQMVDFKSEDATMEEEDGSASDVSNLSPSDEICDKQNSNGFHSEYGEIAGVFYPSVQIEESSQSLRNSPMYQCPFSYCEFETKWTNYLKTHIKTIHEGKRFSVTSVNIELAKRVIY